MKLRNIKDLNAFMSALDRCQSSVWLESIQGDKLDLKSPFTRYISIGRLLEDYNENLMLYTSTREDEAILLEFFKNQKEDA